MKACRFTISVILLAGICSGLFASSARGQEQPIPIVEPQSLVLVKIDLNQVNLPQIQQWLINQIKSFKLPPADEQTAERGLKQAFDQLENARIALGQVGATSMYISFSQSDMQFGPSIYFPVDPAVGVPELVATVIYSGRLDGPKPPDVATVRAPSMRVATPFSGGVFFGPFGNYQRFQASKGTSPALLKALAEAPPGVIQAAFVSTPELNALLEARMPNVPPPVNLPMKTLTQGMKSAGAAIQPPPGPSGVLTIQASDAAAANQFNAIIVQAVPMLGAILKAQAPDFDPQPMIDAIKPQVAGDKLTLALDDAGLQKALAGPIMASFVRSRQSAMRVQSASQIHTALTQIMTIASRNSGKLPGSLQEMNLDKMVNPRAANLNAPGFIYVKGPEKLAEFPRTSAIIYENPDALPPGTTEINAGFPDGSVRFMPLADVLKSLPQPAK